MTDEARKSEKELFEAYATEDGLYVEKQGNFYHEPETENAWEVWQASRAPLLARIAELEAQVATARDDAIDDMLKLREKWLANSPYESPFNWNEVLALKSQHTEGAKP